MGSKAPGADSEMGIGKKLFEPEILELPPKPSPIVQGGHKSTYRARKMRQWLELKAQIESGKKELRV